MPVTSYELPVTRIEPSANDVGVVTNALGVDIGVGTKAGERVNAACKIRRKGVDPVDLVMGVGSEEWAGLKTTRRDEEVLVETTKEHVAKKEYHRRPVTCFVRVDGKKWEAAAEKNSSADLNVFFEDASSIHWIMKDICRSMI